MVQMVSQHGPEHKHGLGLVEERETPVYLWTCLGRHYGEIHRGGEGQRAGEKQDRDAPKFTCGWPPAWSNGYEI